MKFLRQPKGLRSSFSTDTDIGVNKWRYCDESFDVTAAHELSKLKIMITTATIEGLEPAKAIARILLEKEIPVDLVQHKKGDSTIVTLHIEKKDEEDVHSILADNAIETKGLVRCPSCDSSSVEYPGRPRWSPSAAVVEAIAEKLHIREPAFYCRKCQHTWQ